MGRRDEWNAVAQRNDDGTWDVFFDWHAGKGPERRVCHNITAPSAKVAIKAVKTDHNNCLSSSKFVEALDG